MEATTSEKAEALIFCLGPYPFANMAIRQRVLFLAREYSCRVVCRDIGDLRAAIQDGGGSVRACPFRTTSSHLGMLAYVLWAACTSLWFVARHRAGVRLVYSCHDITMLLGWLLRCLPGRRLWISDILDDPALELNNWRIRRTTSRASIIRPALVCLEWVKRRVARKADLNIVQGRDLAARLPQHMMATYSVSSERILPVPNGIALELIRPSAVERDDRAPFTVFYVGYVSQLRGIDTLLQAFALLRRQVPAARLVLAGWAKHDDRAWLDAEIERLGLKGSVQYLGELPSEQVWEQIQESDCCVHPFSADHLSYVYPVKVFEYLALERPVVASRLEGISAIIEDGKNGLLANPGDADDWARALITLASDVSLRKKLMRNARSSIERYSWRRIHSQIHAAIAARASVLLTHPDAADRK